MSTVVAAVPMFPPAGRFAIVAASNRVDPALCNVAFGALVPSPSLLFVVS